MGASPPYAQVQQARRQRYNGDMKRTRELAAAFLLLCCSQIALDDIQMHTSQDIRLEDEDMEQDARRWDVVEHMAGRLVLLFDRHHTYLLVDASGRTDQAVRVVMQEAVHQVVLRDNDAYAAALHHQRGAALAKATQLFLR